MLCDSGSNFIISYSPFISLHGCVWPGEGGAFAFIPRLRLKHFHHISGYSQVIKSLTVALSHKYSLNLVIKASPFLQLGPVADESGIQEGGRRKQLLFARGCLSPTASCCLRGPLPGAWTEWTW